MAVMDFVPIGTLLAVLTTEVIKTARAAQDVAFEKESFKVLSNHLYDIEPVLKELQLKELNDSLAARKALEFLDVNVKRAQSLVDKYTNRSRFYLLLKCRYIVKEVQDVTRDIGKSLADLPLANTEVLLGISTQVKRLHNEMQTAEFESSLSQLQIVDKLTQGITDTRLDPNEILKEIAKAVGVPVDPSEISKELESFRKEKEEAEVRKERAEAFFFEQVIALLSQADAARDYDEVRKQYFQRLQVVERSYANVEYIEPYRSFKCCITGCVMVDPVSLCTGTTCEREALEAWFDQGKSSDPQTGELLDDCSYRSNLQLRQSIQEWKEQIFCHKIRNCKSNLLATDGLVLQALGEMQDLIRENSINKYWITIGGLTEIIISILGKTDNEDVKREILVTLTNAIEGHSKNKDLLIENEGFEDVISCLECDSSISETAVQLLYELLVERPCWNVSYCRKLSQKYSAIKGLVKLRNRRVIESSDKAVEILMNLCEGDEQCIIKIAEAGWYEPLAKRTIEGSESSRMMMVRALVTLKLDEENSKILVEEGLIPTLLEMASGNLESKELSLSVLVKLSSHHDNKGHIAVAGGVPIVIALISPVIRSSIIAKCSEILENLASSGDGIKFLVDKNGNNLELESVIINLLNFQQNPTLPHTIRKPALKALLGICRSEAGLVKVAVLKANGVSAVLPLLDNADLEVRETAIYLLFLFSQHESQGTVEYLLKPRRLEAFVKILENHKKGDAQMASAGVIANLPKSEILLTQKLIEFDGLKAIVDILRSGSLEAKENALSALFRFTDPTNLESQKIVVELGVYPLLVDFIKDGSVTSKARAAALIGDLSMRSLELTVVSKGVGCCFFFPGRRVPRCPAHGGVCSVTKSFCLLAADALPHLVKLLQEKIHATAFEAIQTLSTLVSEESPQRGARVLQESGAIVHIIEVLAWGSESLKEEVLGLLEKVFMSKEMVEAYGLQTRVNLVRLTGRSIHEDGHLQRKAARVLLLIERHSRSSSSSAVGTAGIGE